MYTTPLHLDRLMRAPRLLAVPVLVACAVSAAWPEWPGFRGGPRLTGVASTPLAGDLELLWTLDTAAHGDSAQGGSAGIESTAAISGGAVYVGTLDGRLLAASLADGGIEWAYEATGEVKSSPAVHGNAVLFGDESGTFHAVDRTGGAALWTFAAEGAVTYLEAVGLPARAPPIAPARPHPQHEFDPLLTASDAA